MSAHRIDVHVHAIPDSFKQASLRAGRGATISTGFPTWSVEQHLAFNDRHGIATAIISISQPGAHFGDDAAAAVLARTLNEEMARMVADHPANFGAFAVLPLPNVAAALEEIDYALDVLKLDGVGILTSYQGIFLGDPSFDPVLEKLNAHRAVVSVHPALPIGSRDLSTDYPGFMTEFVIDTTRAVTHMIFSRVMERFPDIRFILSHAGGTIPFLSWRLSMAPLIDRSRFGHLTPEWVMEQVGRFWFDTAISAGAQSIGALHAVAKPERILFGSDFPYCPDTVAERCTSGLADILAPDVLAGVERTNALALFPRLRG
jgi:predicted TIM-barrel fold metal-dependent hydrolase